MSKFVDEFKKFILRGNVVDMAVGVIVGSSFTAIVNALSNNILKPIINYLLALIFGTGALEDAYTFLGKPVYVDGAIDLSQSIYIDWGAFINAILNFFLIALVLFVIVKVINGVRDGHKRLIKEICDDIPTREDKRDMKRLGIKIRDVDAVKAFMEDKKRKAAEAKIAAEAEAAEKARLEKLANPTAEDLLKEILEIMKSK